MPPKIQGLGMDTDRFRDDFVGPGSLRRACRTAQDWRSRNRQSIAVPAGTDAARQTPFGVCVGCATPNRPRPLLSEQRRLPRETPYPLTLFYWCRSARKRLASVSPKIDAACRLRHRAGLRHWGRAGRPRPRRCSCQSSAPNSWYMPQSGKGRSSWKARNRL